MAQLKRVANGYQSAYYNSYGNRPNVALPLEDEWDILPDRMIAQPLTQPKKSVKKTQKIKPQVVEKVHPDHIARRKKAISNCITIIATFLVLAGVVARYGIISTNNLENLELKSNIDELQSVVERTDVELAVANDIQSIERTAKEKGMHFPDAEQVRYISLKLPDEPATQPAQQVQEEPIVPAGEGNEPAFFERALDALAQLFGK